MKIVIQRVSKARVLINENPEIRNNNKTPEEKEAMYQEYPDSHNISFFFYYKQEPNKESFY